MRRREFIAALGGAAAWPLSVRAQQTAGRPIIGLLSPISPASAARLIEAFREGLRDLGYEEGRNIAVETRFADGSIARLPDLAAELFALKPAVLVTGSSAAALAARQINTTIPIDSGNVCHRLSAVTVSRSIRAAVAAGRDLSRPQSHMERGEAIASTA